MTALDLTDDEKLARVRLLRRFLDEARFPLAPRHAPLRAILAKLDPQPEADLPPPIRSGLTPRTGRGRRR